MATIQQPRTTTPTHEGPIKGKQQLEAQPMSQQIAKTTTALTIGGSLMVLSGVTMTGTVIALTLATPLLVIFSPVLVPALITLFLIVTGFIASGGFGAVASFLLYWMYRYSTGKRPIGAEQIERARERISHAAHDVKDQIKSTTATD